jgi:putative ABC transport system permease protein
MSYSVAQRTHEIGIRMALGARRADVLQMTVKQGLKLVSAGMMLGLVAAFLLTRVLASLLYGISATDPITFVGISLVLLAVAILASTFRHCAQRRSTPLSPYARSKCRHSSLAACRLSGLRLFGCAGLYFFVR